MAGLSVRQDYLVSSVIHFGKSFISLFACTISERPGEGLDLWERKRSIVPHGSVAIGRFEP